MTSANANWTITPEPYDSPAARSLWRTYYTDVSDRWYLLHEGRHTDPAELDRGIASISGSELAPPDGRLLVARFAGEPVGTAGVRLLDPATAELTRVFLAPAARGRGGAALLVDAAEGAARELGAAQLVLNTRSDLVEARALYARLGYTEVPVGEQYETDKYADHCFTKTLAPLAPLTDASRRA